MIGYQRSSWRLGCLGGWVEGFGIQRFNADLGFTEIMMYLHLGGLNPQSMIPKPSAHNKTHSSAPQALNTQPQM